MNSEMQLHCRNGARALAAADPLACAKALVEGLAKQSQGAREIVLRYLNAEIKFMNPATGGSFSPPAVAGAPAAAPSPVVAGADYSDPPSEAAVSPAVGPIPDMVRAATAGRHLRRHR